MTRRRDADRLGPSGGGRRYYELLGIFFRHDPMNINFEENIDEYAPEVETVLPRLDQAHDVESTQDLLHEEFGVWFSGDAGPRERYLPVAREVWDWWRTEPKPDPEYDRVLRSWLEILETGRATLRDELGDEAYWAQQAIIAWLAGFRPLLAWAVDALHEFDASVDRQAVTSEDHRSVVERLKALADAVRG